MKSNRFFPFFYKGMKKGKWGVFISYNYDFFRFSIDISTVILLYRFKVLEGGIPFFSALYTFYFLFNLYHYSFAYIYKATPIIANDISLLRDGIAILYNESRIRFFVYITGLCLLLTVVFWLFEGYLTYSSQLPVLPVTYVLASCFGFVSGVATIRKWRYNNRWDLAYRFFLFPIRLVAHIVNSRNMLIRKARLHVAIKGLKKSSSLMLLHQKPNLHVIFIESYGSLLLKADPAKARYRNILSEFNYHLQKGGWHSKNNLSESVTLIGPSWLAYSSFLYGFRIDSHLVYEYLLRTEGVRETDTLFGCLKKNGYINFNLNPTKSIRALKVPMRELTSFYHVDKWILWDDIHYTGLEYGFGEFPADQYTLNYAHEYFLKPCTSPYVLFYLTKNSHSPYVSPKMVMDDWKQLNGVTNKKHSMTGGFLQRPKIDDYIDSIEYQLAVLQKYIVDNGKETDIFLLVGDHQPHELSNENEHGLETIVHIVSKDRNFLGGFENYGFRDCLFEASSPIRHEGLHSAFLREFLRCYGINNEKLPDYEPFGHQLF